MKHVFFASYAREDNRSARLERAVMALRERVRDKLGWSEEELDKIAFFDTTAITTGQQWEDALAEALKKSRILVALCSPTYLNSPYCAKEFFVFRKRLEEAGEAMNGRIAIVPIIWDWGSPKMSLPKAITSFNYKHGELPKKYQDDGLAPLVRLESQADAFEETIEELAKLIGDALAGSKLKDWGGRIKFDELPTYFVDAGEDPPPYNATVCVLHKDRLQWRPYVAGPSIGGRIAATMQSLNVLWREIAPDPAQLVASLQKAQQQKQVAVVIADSVSLGKPQWRTLLQLVDDASLDNCAVLLAWNDEDNAAAAAPAEIKAKLQALLPKSGGSPLHDHFAHDDPDSLRGALERAVTAGRMTLWKKDEPQKVSSESLRAEAIRDGIAPDARPALSGPGGETS
jgi:TIR domain